MGVPVALLLHAHLHPRLRARDLKPVWDSDYECMAHDADAANQPVAMPASEAIGSARPTHVMADTAAPVAALPRVSLSLAGFTLRSLALIVLLVIGVQYLTDLVFVLYDQFAPSVIEEYTDLLEGSGLTSYGVLWFIATIVLPPLVEEAGFRGLALTYFRRAVPPSRWQISSRRWRSVSPYEPLAGDLYLFCRPGAGVWSHTAIARSFLRSSCMRSITFGARLAPR